MGRGGRIMTRKITGWNISVTWEDDEKGVESIFNQDVYNIPDYVASVIDEWFNKIEEKGQGFEDEE